MLFNPRFSFPVLQPSKTMTKSALHAIVLGFHYFNSFGIPLLVHLD